jgi:small subunit ribosomal protein S4
MLQEKKCRLCRREGEKLFLKGERCTSAKCSVTKRNYAPGKNGKTMGRKLSDYGIQLRAKQACKKIYKIREKTLKRYYDLAAKSKTSTGENLIKMLEIRLDNVVYKLGFGASLSASRQLVSHKHILVNSKKVNISSYLVKVKDKISVEKNIQPMIKNTKKLQDIPSWLELSKDKYSGTVLREPSKDDIKTNVDIQLIVEFYSR